MAGLCPAGAHPHNGSQDNYGNGVCKECHKANARRRQASIRAELSRLRELERVIRD